VGSAELIQSEQDKLFVNVPANSPCRIAGDLCHVLLSVAFFPDRCGDPVQPSHNIPFEVVDKQFPKHVLSDFGLGLL
jgi:hypothetical protein